MAEDLRLAGVKSAPCEGQGDDGDFAVYPENWESLEWFLRMHSRWIFNPFNGRRIRFDDVAVLAQLKVHGVKKSTRKIIMEDLLEMESAALEVLNLE